MIKDRNIGYKYQNLFLPAAAFHHISAAGTGDGVPIFGEVEEGQELTAYDMSSELDEVTWGSVMPTWMDFENDIHLRVHYAQNTNVAGDVIWTVNSFQLSFGAETFTTFSGGATISTTTLTDTLDGEGVLVTTPWGKVDGDTIKRSAGDWLKLVVQYTDHGAASADCWFVGLELLYLPKLTDGPQVNDQPAPTDA